MTDVPKHCKRCKHDHATGVLRYDNQNVPLYGARPCVRRVTFLDKKKRKRWRKCGCNKFKEDIGRFELEQEARRNSALPVVKNMDQAEVTKMYAETGYLSPQTPLESRVALYKLWQLPNKVEREREFQRLIAMVTMDTRAALLRSDNKYANLAANADAFIDSLQKLQGMAERFDNVISGQERILAALDKLAQKVGQSDANPLFDAALVCQRCQHLKEEHTDGQAWCRNTTTIPACECDEFTLGGASDCAQCGFSRELHPPDGGHEFVERVSIQEAAHVFASKSAPLWSEPIVTSAEPDDD